MVAAEDDELLAFPRDPYSDVGEFDLFELVNPGVFLGGEPHEDQLLRHVSQGLRPAEGRGGPWTYFAESFYVCVGLGSYVGRDIDWRQPDGGWLFARCAA